MRINQPAASQGSFGLTPQMKESVQSYKARVEKLNDEEDLGGDAVSEESIESVFSDDAGRSSFTQDSSVDRDVIKEDSPLECLKRIGVELSDDDLFKIIFRGYLEKEIVVVLPVGGRTKPLVATFRTLTGEEVDAADELLAEEIGDTKMTNDGYHTRRSMWILSYGLTHLAGKPVCNPVEYTKSKSEDAPKFNMKATIKLRRKVLSTLNPGVLAKMMHLHSIFTVNINAIIANPEADYLKKS